MSRPSFLDDLLHDGFPRVSGDEPFPVSFPDDCVQFSPRERG